MNRRIIDNEHLTLSQGVFSSLVLSALASSFALAYLLYLYPTSEWLWRLSVPVNALMRPAAQPFDSLFGLAPAFTIPAAMFISLLPLTRWWRNTWIASALTTHAAFFVIVLVIEGAMGLSSARPAVASIGTFKLHINAFAGLVPLFALAVASFAFCALSHVSFFMRARSASIAAQ